MAMKNTNKCSYKEEEKDQLRIQYELDQIENIEESREKYRKIVNAGITRWVRDFQGGHIKIDSVEDLKKLIELDLALQKDDEY
ncbi:hypothetical protein EQV77_00860 [Halobacillus fulvus]|nr:hypothetical protein EQV77_00860 [Halobacillus fulvus]